MRKLLVVVIATMASTPVLAWGAQPLVTGTSPMVAVAFGDGDDNGSDEPYSLGHDGILRRFTWTGSAWSNTVVAVLPTGSASLAVGDGDRDGATEVYVGGGDGRVHRLAWMGAAWDHDVLPPLPSTGGTAPNVTAVAVGDGDGNGNQEVYAGAGKRVHMLAYNAGAWTRLTVGDLDARIFGLAIGDAEGDGHPKVWAAAAAGWVWRGARGPSGWAVQPVVNGTPALAFRAVALGDLNGDGRLDLVAGGDDKHVWHFAKLSSGWSKEAVGTLPQRVTGLAQGDLVPANSEGVDGAEAYASSLNSRVYRTWKGAYRWLTADLGGATPLRGLALGDGHGDGVTRGYAGTQSGSVVELAPDRWRAVGSLPEPLHRPVAVRNTTHAFVFGGVNATSQTDAIVRVDLVSGLSTTLATRMPAADSTMSAVWTGSKALVFGRNGAFAFDPATQAITPLNATAPTPFRGTSAAWNGTHAFLFGGSGSDAIRRYDPVLDTFETMNATLPHKSQESCAVWHNDSAWVFGGRDIDGHLIHADASRYTPASDALEILPPIHETYLCSAGVLDGHAYIVGPPNIDDEGIERYTLALDRPRLLADDLPTRRTATAAVAFRGELFVFGGWRLEGTEGSTTEILAYRP